MFDAVPVNKDCELGRTASLPPHNANSPVGEKMSEYLTPDHGFAFLMFSIGVCALILALNHVVTTITLLKRKDYEKKRFI